MIAQQHNTNHALIVRGLQTEPIVLVVKGPDLELSFDMLSGGVVEDKDVGNYTPDAFGLPEAPEGFGLWLFSGVRLEGTEMRPDGPEYRGRYDRLTSEEAGTFAAGGGLPRALRGVA